jgi:hypothetical protein
MPQRGEKHKAETINKIRDSIKGRAAWNKGISHEEITKKKIGISKKTLFSFIKDIKTRSILTRDYAFAEICREHKMFKPAIILYGSIMEEILRNILNSDKYYSDLITEGKVKNIIEPPLARKIEFIRDFRNYVHIHLEKKEDFEPNEEIASFASEVCQSLIKRAKKSKF